MNRRNFLKIGSAAPLAKAVDTTQVKGNLKETGTSGQVLVCNQSQDGWEWVPVHEAKPAPYREGDIVRMAGKMKVCVGSRVR